MSIERRQHVSNRLTDVCEERYARQSYDTELVPHPSSPLTSICSYMSVFYYSVGAHVSFCPAEVGWTFRASTRKQGAITAEHRVPTVTFTVSLFPCSRTMLLCVLRTTTHHLDGDKHGFSAVSSPVRSLVGS